MKYSDLKFDWFGEITASKKNCKICLKEKDLSNFYIQKGCKYGTRPECKNCFNIKSKKYKEKYKKTDNYKSSTKKYNQSEKHKSILKKYKKSKKGKAQKSIEGIKRRISIISAMPKWLTEKDLLLIKQIYEKCAELNLRDGPRTWHVDHIIPLRGENICGLHVPSNLQILKSEINIKKGNRYEIQ